MLASLRQIWRTNGALSSTSLVISELNGLIQFELVSVHLGVKAVEGLQHDSEIARAQVN